MEQGERGFEGGQLIRDVYHGDGRHARKNLMTIQMSGMIYGSIAIVVMRLAGIVGVILVRGVVIDDRVACRTLMRCTAITRERRKRSGQRLQRKQQNQKERKFFPPIVHGRRESIQKCLALQIITADTGRTRKFLGC